MRNTIVYYIFAILYISSSCSSNKIDSFSESKEYPNISPDYINVVIPPNIAPLNFQILDKAEKYHVKIRSTNGDPIIIEQNDPSIKIPLHKWHQLLEANKGNNLSIDIFTYNGNWVKYKTISDSIVSDSIDKYIVYRLINGAYILWKKMGIYQRNVETFDQTPIFENTSADDACVNCHMFSKHNPEKFQLHLRGKLGGTVIWHDQKLEKIDTKVSLTVGACAYPSWHPGGNLIAYSVNVIRQNMTSDHTETQFVFDKASDIVLYNVKTKTLHTVPVLSTKNRENLPNWSPDGKTMYYISAPEFNADSVHKFIEKYSLVRISYDEATNTFGIPDTLINSSETGLSITFPVASPDGRHLLFGMVNHGYFPVYNAECDIYILDLETKKYIKAPFNSNSTDSYHSWSSTGRWVAFSSKRMDNTFSRTYFSYFDKNGNAYKPFVLPQEDPLFYDRFMKNFNRPEMVTGKVMLSPIDTRDVAFTGAQEINVK